MIIFQLYRVQNHRINDVKSAKYYDVDLTGMYTSTFTLIGDYQEEIVKEEQEEIEKITLKQIKEDNITVGSFGEHLETLHTNH